MNVVIVEDDINMRKSLEIALGDYEEFSVKSYKSATEALKKLSSDTDIIVTDINMPGMDGLEFIKELDGKYDVSRKVPVLKIGKTEGESVIEAIKKKRLVGLPSRLSKSTPSGTTIAAKPGFSTPALLA